MPTISIITTTYKHEKFITHTIDSILAQSFIDWELLIGDDSPDDATWNKIQSYVEQYPDKIRAWHHSPNKWIVWNTNFLLQNISKDSKYIAFLEWDDKYTPDNLQKKLDIFKKFPEVQLVYSDLSFIDQEGMVIKRSFYEGVNPFPDTPLSKDGYFLSGKSIFSYSSMMVRASVFGTISLLDWYSLVSDYDFVGKIISRYSIYFLDEPLTRYRIHTDNASLGSAAIAYSMLDLIERYHSDWRLNEKVYTILKSRIYTSIASWNILLGERALAIWALLSSCRYAFTDQVTRKIKALLAIFFPTSFIKKQFYSRFFDAHAHHLHHHHHL